MELVPAAFKGKTCRPGTVLALLITLLLLGQTGSAWADPGDLDPTFGNGGKTTTDLAENDEADALAIGADGKLVIAGHAGPTLNTGDFAVVRYLSNGTLDSSFGRGGSVVTDFARQNDRARAVLVQPDGKVVAAGGARSSGFQGSDFALARYLSNGRPDKTFGRGGKVVTRIDDRSWDVALDIALQPDGKLVVAGWADLGPRGVNNFVVARYQSSGRLDSSFGNSGKVITRLGSKRGSFGGIEEGAQAVQLQADGKIVVAGPAEGLGSYDFALVRYNQDGSLDSSFGFDGTVVTEVTDSGDVPWGLALQPDGKLVSAGLVDAGDGRSYDFGVVRHNTDGTLDTTFGDNGRAITAIAGSRADYAKALALQGDGKMVVGGTAYLPPPEQNFDFALERLSADGVLDADFGDAGVVTTPFEVFGTDSRDTIEEVAIQEDGAVVVAGRTTHRSNWDDSDIALARYQGDR